MRVEKAKPAQRSRYGVERAPERGHSCPQPCVRWRGQRTRMSALQSERYERRTNCRNSSNGSKRNVGQTSGLTVSRASDPEFHDFQDHGVGDSVNRQTGGLPHL